MAYQWAEIGLNRISVGQIRGSRVTQFRIRYVHYKTLPFYAGLYLLLLQLYPLHRIHYKILPLDCMRICYIRRIICIRIIFAMELFELELYLLCLYWIIIMHVYITINSSIPNSLFHPTHINLIIPITPLNFIPFKITLISFVDSFHIKFHFISLRSLHSLRCFFFQYYVVISHMRSHREVKKLPSERSSG